MLFLATLLNIKQNKLFFKTYFFKLVLIVVTFNCCNTRTNNSSRLEYIIRREYAK